MTKEQLAKILADHIVWRNDPSKGSRADLRDAYLIARFKKASQLNAFGTYDVLLRSERSRYELTPADRYTLFHLQLRPDLPAPAGIHISVLQATGRAPGPYLTGTSGR